MGNLASMAIETVDFVRCERHKEESIEQEMKHRAQRQTHAYT